jgi:ubiquinone/menaquinone biosynthesis C-methylase UbiE
MDFRLTSYSKHKNLSHNSDLVSTWSADDTVDYWRHERMFNNLLPLLRAYPKNSWLTVGDGRYGTDAHFILRNEGKALATDINDQYLKIAKNDRFIDDYKVENAESLSFDDDAFDFALCKESYHHFPRPMIALYEMLRVSRKAIAFIEPNDTQAIDPYSLNFNSIRFWLFQGIKNMVKKTIGRQSYIPEPGYESVGNYVYSISRREFEKVALGLNLPMVAFKGFNDCYLEGVENEKVADMGKLQSQIKRELSRADMITKKRPEQSGLLVAIIFKIQPTDECMQLLKQGGFSIHQLKRNPYASNS